MENLNVEQVTNPNIELYDYVKRIVAAVEYKGEGDHEDVPSILKKFAKGYEQRIKELTEENETIAKLLVEKTVTVIEFDKQIERLTEENERLIGELAERPPKLIITKLSKGE